MMKPSWHLRDYIFAALMTLGMLIAAFVIANVAPRFLELIFWAPVGGIFLTLGMARLQFCGSVALMVMPLAILLGILSLAVGVYLGITAVLTETIVFLRGNYRAKNNRLLGNVIFFTTALVMGYITAAFMVGDEFATLLTQPLLFGGLIVAVAMTGTLGWWLGEMILWQLKRMGKWKEET